MSNGKAADQTSFSNIKTRICCRTPQYSICRHGNGQMGPGPTSGLPQDQHQPERNSPNQEKQRDGWIIKATHVASCSLANQRESPWQAASTFWWRTSSKVPEEDTVKLASKEKDFSLFASFYWLPCFCSQLLLLKFCLSTWTVNKFTFWSLSLEVYFCWATVFYLIGTFSELILVKLQSKV